MMRILFFIHSLSSGGAERVTAMLANFWAHQNDVQVSVVTISGNNLDFYELDPNVKRFVLGLDENAFCVWNGIVNNYDRIIALRAILMDFKPDVAISMMSTANVILALAAKGTTIVTVGSERIYPPMLPLGKPWNLLRRWSYGLLDVVVAQTQLSAQWIQSHTLARKVAVIPNPLVYPIPVSQPIIAPTLVGNSSKKRILAVGRLTYQKGFDLLLQAFHQVAKSYADWELVILGEGELRSELEQRITNLGLSEQVFLPGRVGNVGDWYASADIFVLSSRFEGFPNALLEAMASGVAVVSFDCETGPRDIIRHGRNGLLVNAEDVQGLAEAMAELMGDENLRKQLSENAIAVRDEFSIERIANEWEQLWNQFRR